MTVPALGDRRVRFGLAGCGVISDTYAAALAGLASAELVAVHDADQDRAAAFCRRHRTAQSASLEELVSRPDVDAVCVCVPSGLHAQVAVAAAEAGKHLVVEKPIEVDQAAARHLIEAAARNAVALNVVSQQRYNPGVLHARALLRAGRLGDVLFVEARVPWYRSQAYYDSAAWRGTWAMDGGGAFMNQGVHYADLLCWLFGQPSVLAAHCARLDHEMEAEDLALALLRFPSGAAGTLVASTLCYPGFPAELNVHGTSGSLRLVDGALVDVQLQGADVPTPADVGRLGMPDGHRAQLADIVTSLQDGSAPPVSGEDGYRALSLVVDTYRAARWKQ